MERKSGGKKPSFPEEQGNVNLLAEISDEEFDTVEEAAQQPLRVTYKHPAFRPKHPTRAPRKSTERESSSGGITSFILPPPDAHLWGKIKTEHEELKVKFMAVGDTYLSRIEGWYGLEPITNIRQESEELGIDISDMAYAMKLRPLIGGENEEYEIIITRRVKRPNSDLPRTGTVHLSYPYTEQSFRDSREVSSALHEIRRRTLSNKSFTKRTPNKGKVGQNGAKSNEEDEISSISMDEHQFRHLSSAGRHNSALTDEKGFVNDDLKSVMKSLANKRNSKMDRGDTKDSILCEPAEGDLHVATQTGFYKHDELIFIQINMNFYCYPIFSTSRAKSLKTSLSKTRNKFSVNGGIKNPPPKISTIERKRESALSELHNSRQKNTKKISPFFLEKTIEAKKGSIQTSKKINKTIFGSMKQDIIMSGNETPSAYPDIKMDKEVSCQISDSKEQFCEGNNVHNAKTISMTLMDSIYSSHRPTKNAEEIMRKAKKKERLVNKELSFGLGGSETRKKNKNTHKIQFTDHSLKADNRISYHASKSNTDPSTESKNINLANQIQSSYISSQIHQNIPKRLTTYQGSKLRTQSKKNYNKTNYTPDNCLSIHQLSHNRSTKVCYGNNKLTGNKESTCKITKKQRNSDDHLRTNEISKEMNITNKNQINKKYFEIDSENSYRAKKLRTLYNKDFSENVKITKNISNINSSNQSPIFNYIYAAREESQRKYRKRQNISFKLSLNEDVINDLPARNTENYINYCSEIENKRPNSAKKTRRESQECVHKNKVNTTKTSNENTSFYEFPIEENTKNAKNVERTSHKSELYYADTKSNITRRDTVHNNKKKTTTSSSKNDEKNQYRLDKSKSINQKYPYLEDKQEISYVSQNPNFPFEDDQERAYQNMKSTETSYVDPDLKETHTYSISIIEDKLTGERYFVNPFPINDPKITNILAEAISIYSKVSTDDISPTNNDKMSQSDNPTSEISEVRSCETKKLKELFYMNPNLSVNRRISHMSNNINVSCAPSSFTNSSIIHGDKNFPDAATKLTRMSQYSSDVYETQRTSSKENNMSYSNKKQDNLPYLKNYQEIPHKIRLSRELSHVDANIKDDPRICDLNELNAINQRLSVHSPCINAEEFSNKSSKLITVTNDDVSLYDHLRTSQTGKLNLPVSSHSEILHERRNSEIGAMADPNRIDIKRIGHINVDAHRQGSFIHQNSLFDEEFQETATKLSSIPKYDNNANVIHETRSTGNNLSFSSDRLENQPFIKYCEENPHKIRISREPSYADPNLKNVSKICEMNNTDRNSQRLLVHPLSINFEELSADDVQLSSASYKDGTKLYDEQRNRNTENNVILSNGPFMHPSIDVDEEIQYQTRNLKPASYLPSSTINDVQQISNIEKRECFFSHKPSKIDKAIPRVSTEFCIGSSNGIDNCYHCNSYSCDDLRVSNTGNDICFCTRDQSIKPSLETYQENSHNNIKSNLAFYINPNSNGVQRLSNHYFPRQSPPNLSSTINDEIPNNYEEFTRVPHYASKLYYDLKAGNTIKDENCSTTYKNDATEFQVPPRSFRKPRMVSHQVHDLKEVFKISIMADKGLTNLSNQKISSVGDVDSTINHLSTHKPISHEIIKNNITTSCKICYSDSNLYNSSETSNTGTDMSFSNKIQNSRLSYFLNQASSHQSRNSISESYVDPYQKISKDGNRDTSRQNLCIPLPSKYDGDILTQSKKLTRVFNNNNITGISDDDKKTSNTEKTIQPPSEVDCEKQTQISSSGDILFISEKIPKMSTHSNRVSYHENERSSVNEPSVTEVNSNNGTKLCKVFQYFSNENGLLMTIYNGKGNNLTLGQPDNLENSITKNTEIDFDLKMNRYNNSAFITNITNERLPHQSVSLRKRSYLYNNANELRNLGTASNGNCSNITTVHYLLIQHERDKVAESLVDSTISLSLKTLNIIKNNPTLCEILSNYAKADSKKNGFDRITKPSSFKNFPPRSNQTNDIEDENRQTKYSSAEKKCPTEMVTEKVFKNSNKKSPAQSEDVRMKSQKLYNNSLNLDKKQSRKFRKFKSSYPESPNQLCQCREKEEFLSKHHSLKEKEGTGTEYELTIEPWKFMKNCFTNCKNNPIIRLQRKKCNFKN